MKILSVLFALCLALPAMASTVTPEVTGTLGRPDIVLPDALTGERRDWALDLAEAGAGELLIERTTREDGLFFFTIAFGALSCGPVGQFESCMIDDGKTVTFDGETLSFVFEAGNVLTDEGVEPLLVEATYVVEVPLPASAALLLTPLLAWPLGRRLQRRRRLESDKAL